MKKISLLIFHTEYQRFLEKLRDKGVVHIRENEEHSRSDGELKEKLQLVKRINDMTTRLGGRSPSENPGTPKKRRIELLSSLEGGYRSLEQATQTLNASKKDLATYNVWGVFPEEEIEKLKRAGWSVRFLTTPLKSYKKEWEEENNAFPITESGGVQYFVAINQVGKEEELPDTEHFIFPASSVEHIKEKIRDIEEEIDRINNRLDIFAKNSTVLLEEYRTELFEEIDELKVKGASSAIVENRVMALEGWLPKDKVEDLKEFLLTQEVYFEFSDSTPADDVPTKLKNGRFSRLFEPIGDLYSLPNYNELDVTPFFAPFFMLFFGMCLGDGGYGVLLLLASLLLMHKVPQKFKGYLKLGVWLGASTTFVGLLTGSFFGIALDSVTWPWLQGIKQYFLTEANFGKHFGGYNPLMYISFALGGAQILLGMCLNAVKITMQHGFKYAVSNVGWIVLLVSLLIVFGLPTLGVTLPLFLVWFFYGLIGVSAFAILFMNSPDKNIFVNIGSSIWDSYNMVTGLLGDILSYVRLFALGLTGSILGGVFNMIAFDMTGGIPGVPRFIIVLIILLVGHSLNFIIAMIGALVHPMRLTFVEFYKNAGFEGMGTKYEPFRNRVDN